MNFFKCNNDKGKDLKLLGISCDFGSAGDKGCAQAPSILNLLSQVSGNSSNLIDISSGRTLFDTTSICDLGIIKYEPTQKIDNFISGIELIAQDAFKNSTLITLGGDHLVAYPLIKACADSIEKIQILQLDAHFDDMKINENSQISHNNFVSFLSEHKNIDQWITIGQRGFSKDSSTKDRTIRSDIYSCVDLLKKNIPIYLTIDMDVVDLKEFSAVNFPQPGLGLSLDSILNLISKLISLGFVIKGIDICEYNPKLDSPNYINGRTLVYFLSQVIAILKNGVKFE